MGILSDVISNLISDRIEPEGEDYYGEDNLLHCGKCGQRKERKILWPSFNGGPDEEKIVPVACTCKLEKMKQDEERQKLEEELQRMAELRKSSLMDEKLRNANFESFLANEDNKKLLEVAKRYASKFSKMEEDNQGILFYGAVGTGKSFAAACIVNALLEKRITVVMTSFVKILQEIQNFQTDESSFVQKLNSCRLLVIDDLGTERNTEYALEKVYNIIDSRYRAKKPLILTTNLSLQEMQGVTDIRYKRIYDRIFEMCYPVRVVGKSWREQEAARRYDEMKKLLEG